MNKIGKRAGAEQPNVRTEYPDPQAAARAPDAGAVDRPGFRPWRLGKRRDGWYRFGDG